LGKQSSVITLPIFQAWTIIYRKRQEQEASMSLDKTQVEKIAHLARLQIDPADVAEYATNLSNILDLVAQMDAVATDGVTPMAHPTEAVQRLREDRIIETDQRDHFQAIAPLVENGLYLVPKVIE